MSKTHGRPFEVGNQAGKGRPKGSRNKAKGSVQRLLDEYGEAVTRKCLAQALQGDRSAMRLCMERLSPARRDAFVRLSLPAIRTVQDVERAAEKVTRAIRRGELTPNEGETMMQILESRAGVIEKVAWEKRIGQLEQEAAERREQRPAA